MKNVLSPKLILFANKVAKVPLVKTILKPLYYPYKRWINSKRNKMFLTNGVTVISDFHNCFEENSLTYTLAFGTMLGAVREHGFIKHDLDLDVFIWAEDYSPNIQLILEANGFRLEHSFIIDEGKSGREETYSKMGVSIDIFYIYPPIDTYQYTCDFSPFPDCVTWEDSQNKKGGVRSRRIEIPISKDRVQILCEGVNLYVPANYDEFLRFRYGDDYMIPNPKWQNGENPHIIEWKDKMAQFKNY